MRTQKVNILCRSASPKRVECAIKHASTWSMPPFERIAPLPAWASVTIPVFARNESIIPVNTVPVSVPACLGKSIGNGAAVLPVSLDMRMMVYIVLNNSCCPGNYMQLSRVLSPICVCVCVRVQWYSPCHLTACGAGVCVCVDASMVIHGLRGGGFVQYPCLIDLFD